MLDEGNRLLHVIFHLIGFLFDHPSPDSALLRWWWGLGDDCFLHLAVRPVLALLYLGALHFTFQTKLGSFRPTVVLKGLFVHGHRLFEGIYFLLDCGVSSLRVEYLCQCQDAEYS